MSGDLFIWFGGYLGRYCFKFLFNKNSEFDDYCWRLKGILDKIKIKDKKRCLDYIKDL